MANLKELLTAYDANVLKALARERGWEPRSQNKTALANLLAQNLPQRELVARALQRLNSVEREILTRLQRAGGEVASGALKRVLEKTQVIAATPQRKDRWGMPDPHASAGNPNYSGKPTLEDAVARLTLLGLVFSREIAAPNKQVLGWELGRYLVIPPEIRAFLPQPAPEQTQATPEPERIVSGSARTFQRDLSRYWGFVRRAGRLDLTTQGWMYKKTLLEIAKALGWQEDKKLDERTHLYPYFLRRMLVALNLLQPQGGNDGDDLSALTFLPSESKDFWARSPAERVKATFEAWLDTTTWNELRIPKATYGYDHRRSAPADLKQARRVVLEHLKRRGAAGWVNLVDLLDDIRLAHYEFLFPRPKIPAYSAYGSQFAYASPYYYSNNRFGISYKGVTGEAEGWDQIEGAIITHMLAGPLHWIGLTDVGFDQNAAEPRAYRLTAMGAWLLGIGAPVTIAEEGGRVVIQPNFQIVAMEPIAEGVLMTLDEFAQFEGGERALTYRLTRESVYRGQRADWDGARIIAYLEDATHAPLPQNVKRSLEEWQALHERITFRRGVTLLQAESAATLDELYAEAALASKLGRRVVESVALPDGTAPAVADGLREAGWLPVVTHGDQRDAPASVAADAEGNVQFVQRTPSIYAYRGIEPFAEWLDARHARITRASVRAAVEQKKMTIPDLLARLRSVHRGELPPKLILRLKAWGKYFGDAHAGRLTLIEFRDEAARKELLVDPELQPYLTRFEAGPRPLALVRADAMERVAELLAERGVEIREFET